MSLSLDLDMPDDLGIRSFDQSRPLIGCGEDPISCSALLEGIFLDPALPLLTVSFSKPGPQLRVDDMIDLGEGCRGRTMPVVVRPAADDRIERLNQPFLMLGPGFLHDVPGLFQKRFDAFGGRLRQALVSILPDAMTEERESFPNMHDTRLLWSYFETAFP